MFLNILLAQLPEGVGNSSEEENTTMNTNPMAQSSESVPDLNQAALTLPTPVRNVVDFREGPAGTVEEHRLHAVSEAANSKAWQLATLLVPIVLTTWLTFWVSQKEDNIKQDIDKQSQLFSQQLQLSEELYKRRFDAYEKLYVQLAQLNGKLGPYKNGGAESKINADRAAQLNELFDLNKLHMSRKVENLTGQAWFAAARQDGPLLSGRIEELRAAMKTELDDWMVEKKEAHVGKKTAVEQERTKPQTRSSQ
jgi:hypothetical protein